jgi:hypothetical protein
MRRIRLLIPVLLAVFVLGPMRLPAEVYDIASYRACIQLLAMSADADVTLDITYNVTSGPKSGGFKYVGMYSPINAWGIDETGASIRVDTKKDAEYQVYWSFPAIQSGVKRVIIHFRLQDVLVGDGSSNTLNSKWIGIFKVPVRHAVYEIDFPPGFLPEYPSEMSDRFTRGRSGDRETLTFTQDPLADTGLSLRFSPGLVGAPAQLQTNSDGISYPVSPEGADEPVQARANSDNDSGFGGLILIIFLIAAGAILFGIINRAGTGSNGKDSSGDSSWSGFVGGCGGGGGGCGGGGCGGGGCGGGCGG